MWKYYLLNLILHEAVHSPYIGRIPLTPKSPATAMVNIPKFMKTSCNMEEKSVKKSLSENTGF